MMRRNTPIEIFFLVLIGLINIGTKIYGQDTLAIQQLDTLQMRTKSFMAASSTTIEMPQVMTPSPKATSIMRYGEYPVSLYTGLVDITVPIYMIERSGVKVPIEFKYHASGLRYDDVSNEVGLGWSLIAGGVITYCVVGGGGNGDYSKDVTKINPCNSMSTTNDYSIIREIENGGRDYLSYDNSIGKKDGEINTYSFSFLNHSGSFCFPAEQTIVNKAAPSTGLFIPANGMKVTKNEFYTIELLDADGVFYKFEVKDNDYYSLHKERQKEFYLTEVISANKADTISFSYEKMFNSQSYIRRPYINYSIINETITRISTCIVDNSTTPIELGGLFYQQMRPPRLRKIKFRGGYIDFDYNNQPWSLKDIKVYSDIQATPIQTIVLAKSKFSNQEDRLDKVIFKNIQNQTYDYEFAYNGEPGNIHAFGTTSAGIDYWGFFNGTTVTRARYVPQFENINTKIKGADRSSNDTHMQKGVLNKIIYPTRGYTEFTYEAHKASYYSGAPMETFGGLRIKEIKNYLPDGSLAEKKWYKYGNQECGYGSANMYPNVNDFKVSSRSLNTHGEAEYATHLCTYTDITKYLSFPKRNYFISGSSVVYPQVTEYTGNNTQESGKTIYAYNIFLDEKMYAQGDTYRWNTSDKHTRTYPWKNGQLSSKRVYKKEGNTYKEVYSIVNNYADKNESEFRNLRVLSYISLREDLDAWAAKSPELLRDFCRHDDYRRYFEGSHYTPYDYFNYYTTTGLRVLDTSTETADGVAVKTTYSYNQNGLPTTITRTTSTGDNVKIVNKYPTDFTSDTYKRMVSANILTPVIEQESYKGSNFLGKEISNYQLFHSLFYAPVTKQVQYSNKTTESRMLYGYNRRGNISSATKDNAENVVYLWGYNSQYAIAEIKNATYSEVETAAKSVFSAASISVLANMATPNEVKLIDGSLQRALPNAIVTTFTYKPLVGMTSMTDPSGLTTYYTYDTAGRLQETYIKENGKKRILNLHFYNYPN